MKRNILLFACIFLLTSTPKSFGQLVLDAEYGTGGITNTGVSSLTSLLLNDNKVLVPYSISMSYPFSSPAFGLRRFNTDGTLDTTFGTNGIATFTSTRFNGFKDRFEIYNLIKQPDGKIIIAGQTHQIGGFVYFYNFFLFRFNADGSADNTFGTNGLVIHSINTTAQFRERFLDVALDSSNRIVAVGFTTADIDEKNNAVAMRFLPNGSVDPAFATNGVLELNFADSDFFNHVYFTDNNAMLITGATVQSPNQNMMIAKINESGTFDNTFGNNGIASVDFGAGSSYSPTKIFFKPNNKLLLVGQSTSDLGSRAAFSQFNNDGSLDTTFSSDGKNLTTIPVPNHYSIGAQYIELMPDNKYLIASTTKRNDDSSNNYDFAVARIKEDTTLDFSFESSGVFVNVVTGTNEFVRGLFIQSDAKALVFVNGTIRRYIVDGLLSSTETELNSNNVTIAPNPFFDKIALQSATEIQKVEIFNIEGKLIETVNATFDEIELAAIDQGIYFLKIYTNDQIYHKKVMKR